MTDSQRLRKSTLLVTLRSCAGIVIGSLTTECLIYVKAHADELFAGMRGARDTSPLPEEPDRQAAEALLVKIVRESVEKATEGAAQ